MSDSEKIRISPLADYPEAVPVLAEWLRAEWQDYYGKRSQADVLEELRAGMNRERLELRLVAFVEGELAGTAILREHPISIRPQLRPGLGGLLVAPSYRGRGVGTELVRACVETARTLGFDELHAATSTADGIFLRLGWERTETVVHHGYPVNLYRCAPAGAEAE